MTSALGQQTATSEILRTISSSPTDVRPVFQSIVYSAKRLLGAFSVTVARRAGDELHLAALSSVSEAGDARVRAAFPFLIKKASTAGPIEPFVTSLLSQKPFVVSDAQTQSDIDEKQREIARARGFRSQLVVPLLRQQSAVGIISVTRREAGSFTEDEVALLQTFADQAVIAIENVRLFTELQTSNHELTTALEQQTATSEILRVISRSQTDVQPVFDTIARSSILLCGAAFSVVAILDADEMLHLVASEHVGTEGRQSLAAAYPMRPNRGELAGRAILDRAVVHVPDVTLDPEYVGAALGNRATLSVPMLRQAIPIGTITTGRFEPLPFPEQQVALLRTFADQAVIAIENVRLFKELEARNRDLTEALEQQTATSEILRVISNSPTNIQPVLDTLAETAARLCKAYDVSIRRVDGDDRQTIHIADAQAETREFPEGSALARQLGHRTILTVPLLREGLAIGTINLRRVEVLPFTDKQITLLQTFADQAVIAIENVRLFTELQEEPCAHGGSYAGDRGAGAADRDE